MLRASCIMVTPLDIAWFLAIQESYDKLINCIIPIGSSATSAIAKVSIKGLFPRGLEVSVEHLGELGIAFNLCTLLFLVSLQELGICEGNEKLNTVCPIVGNHLRRNLVLVLKSLLVDGDLY